jgi:hypothetical protein
MSVRLFLYFSTYLKPMINIEKPLSKHQKKTVFWHTLFGAFIDKIIASGLIKFVHDLLQLSGPLVLK